MNRKKLLIVMPYVNIYPPRTGGMLRCFNLFIEYNKIYDTTILIQQEKSAFLACRELYPEVRPEQVVSACDFPHRKDIFDLLGSRFSTTFRYRYLVRDISKSADSSFLDLVSALDWLAKEKTFDVIVLENLSLTPAAAYFKRAFNGAKLVFDSYNVDSNLVMEEFKKGNATKQQVEAIERQEKDLYKEIDMILCCSEDDLVDFVKLNNNRLKSSLVVPNGVDTVLFNFEPGQKTGKENQLLFCGSLNYAPNKEGLLWFYEQVWPIVVKAQPDVRLTIVGRGDDGSYEKLKQHPNIHFVGEVNDLSPYYHNNVVSIVPLLTGSGTRLKILEAMAFGTAVISTTIGAKGINYTDGQNIVIADSATDFAERLLTMAADVAFCEHLSNQARNLVEKQYSWTAIGKKLHEVGA